jgi:dihydroflavonol-4-reductase
MTTIVTGASGHLGGVLVRALIARGHRVRALYRHDQRALAGLDCTCMAIDVTDIESLKPAFEGGDLLFHLAALISITGGQGGLVEATNVQGVRNVMECALAAGVRRVVHCSSVHAFDLSARQHGTIDETGERPKPGKQGAYDLSKAAGEAQVRAAIARGLDAVIINPSGVIGPCDFKPSRMGQVFIKLAQRRLPATVRGGFDFVDVRDVIGGAIAAAERGRTGDNYILSGSWQSTADLARMAQAVTGARAPRMNTPMFLARMGAPFATLYARVRGSEPLYTAESLAALRAHPVISHAKATAELDYRPRPIEQGIADIYEWFARAGVLELGKGHA